MKIKFLGLGLVAALSIAAASVLDVNKKVEILLAQFNNKATKTSLEFKSLNINSERALDFGVTGLYRKIGSENELVIKLNNIEYHYGDGLNPKVNIDVSADLNLLVAFGQSDINEMSKNIAEIAVAMSKRATSHYGEAIIIEAAMSDLKTDIHGDVESVKMDFSARIDFSKLPNDLKKAEDVEFKTLSLVIFASRKNLGLRGEVVMNPLYKSFKRDQVGLKEDIEALLNEDPNIYAQIVSLVKEIDHFAEEIVNTKAPATR